jgi:hypothetical protein
MQFWIFHEPGVGGDGFSNLLEHANYMTPADNHYVRWRYHILENNSIRFSAARFSTMRDILKNFTQSLNDINQDLNNIVFFDHYLNLVKNKNNTVITFHPYEYLYLKQNFKDWKGWEILEKNQFKILVYSTNVDRVIKDISEKLTSNEKIIEWHKHRISQHWEHRCPQHYNLMIDIDHSWTDWNYLKEKLILAGISLDKKYYDEYLDISGRRKTA